MLYDRLYLYPQNYRREYNPNAASGVASASLLRLVLRATGIRARKHNERAKRRSRRGLGSDARMSLFVWSKMHAEGGQRLPTIVALMERDRAAGNGLFWWDVGNSLGSAFDKFAVQAGGMLPVLFSMMKTQAQKRDGEPEGVFLWTEWDDRTGH